MILVMQDTDSLSSWRSQLRKGAAELAVLAFLGRGEAYGLEILQAITSSGELGVSEGSIYPLLKRLEKSGKIKARWAENNEGGAPRKYYALSPEGAALLNGMSKEWRTFSNELTRLVEDHQ